MFLSKKEAPVRASFFIFLFSCKEIWLRTFIPKNYSSANSVYKTILEKFSSSKQTEVPVEKRKSKTPVADTISASEHPRETFSLEEAVAFFSENYVELPEDFHPDTYILDRACIDGRVRLDEKGLVGYRVPGDMLGKVLTVIAAFNALGWDDANLVEKVIYTFLIKGDGKLYMHSDDQPHGDPDQCYVGCSHCKYALKKTEPYDDPTVRNAYGIRNGQIDYINNFIATHKDEIEVKVLEGRHEERALFMIYSDKVSIPGTGKDGKQAFAFHPDVRYESSGYMVREIASKSHAIEMMKPEDREKTLDELELAAVMSVRKQTSATVEMLRANELPVFDVRVTNTWIVLKDAHGKEWSIRRKNAHPHVAV